MFAEAFLQAAGYAGLLALVVAMAWCWLQVILAVDELKRMIRRRR